MAAEIGRAIGREVVYIDVPEQAAVDSMTGMGHPPRRFGDFVREHVDAWR